jgi:hypothetical protein
MLTISAVLMTPSLVQPSPILPDSRLLSASWRGGIDKVRERQKNTFLSG